MSDSDDDLKRRYRELAREEPSSALDAAILAKARQRAETRDAPSFSAPAGKEGASLVSGSFRRWSVPLSLAAVLMLGVGVSLRMQLEKPGVETSMPNEYAMPESAEPAAASAPTTSVPAEPAPTTNFAAPAPAAKPAPPSATGTMQPAQAPKAAARSAPSAPAEPAFVPTPPPASPQPPAPMPASPASPLARDQGVLAPAPERLKERAENRVRADSFAPPPPPAAAELKANAPSAITVPASTPPPAALGAAAPAAPAAAPQPQRAKRESESDAASGARALGKSLSRDPQVELERIAKLRENGQHAEADKALDEFRKLHPGYRIPEAMWERVRPR